MLQSSTVTYIEMGSTLLSENHSRARVTTIHHIMKTCH
jgi:hypothetical protein